MVSCSRSRHTQHLSTGLSAEAVNEVMDELSEVFADQKEIDDALKAGTGTEGNHSSARFHLVTGLNTYCRL
jgi:hypothetical protein